MNPIPRSVLFVPGGRADMIAKAPRSSPDAIVVDLEDAVAASDKAGARSTAVAAVGELEVTGPRVLIRVNGPATEWYADDVTAVADAAGVSGVVLPKLEDPAQVSELRARLPFFFDVVAGLETARGVASCRALLAAPGLLAAYFGAEDYIASVGGRRTAAGDEVLYARSEVLLAARLAGIGALDQTVVAVRDTDAFRADAARGRELGYEGKLCIHPSQVEIAHEIFTPSDEEVAHAREVLEASRSGVGTVNGEMVDDVHVRMASATLARART